MENSRLIRPAVLVLLFYLKSEALSKGEREYIMFNSTYSLQTKFYIMSNIPRPYIMVY